MSATGSATQAGERFCDVGGGVTLCYEMLGDPSDPPVLLVMGLGMQLIAWDDDFCQMFVDRGYCVVRFDNRDAGRSTSMDGPPPGVAQLATRRFDERQYDLVAWPTTPPACCASWTWRPPTWWARRWAAWWPRHWPRAIPRACAR
jgi:pimeloyl-ACP methyl ester carboxylesterase